MRSINFIKILLVLLTVILLGSLIVNFHIGVAQQPARGTYVNTIYRHLRSYEGENIHFFHMDGKQHSSRLISIGEDFLELGLSDSVILVSVHNIVLETGYASGENVTPIIYLATKQ
jgi:hypothetical protein